MPDSLPWDTILPAYYENLNRVTPYLPALRTNSVSRLATNREFAWLNDDIARLQKQLNHPVASLNEAVRLQEKQEQEAREKSRQELRAQQPAPVQTQYEITLKIAVVPGLPAPMTITNTPVPKVHSAVATNRTDTADKVPVVDITMEETKRILADYISLLPASSIPTLGDTAATAPASTR
jgi:hypothetical protein